MTRRSRGWAMVVGFALVTPITGAAQAKPTTERPCPSEEVVNAGLKNPCKDGFFARFGVKASVLRARALVVQVDGAERYERQIDGTSVAPAWEVTLGGTLRPGLLLGGFLSMGETDVVAVDVRERGSLEPDFVWTYEQEGSYQRRFTLGPAFVIYPQPTRGLVFDVRPNVGALETSEPDDFSYSTYGVELGAGYELWLRPNLGMGLSLRADIARGRSELLYRRAEDYEAGWLVSTGLALTLTLH